MFNTLLIQLVPIQLGVAFNQISVGVVGYTPRNMI